MAKYSIHIKFNLPQSLSGFCFLGKKNLSKSLSINKAS